MSPQFLWARVFDMGSEKFAGYLKADYAPSTVGQGAFGQASNNGETYDASLSYLYAGEFGFFYATPGLSFRFGLEVVRPPTTKANATNSGGTSLYAVNSDISIVIPKFGVELALKKWKESRLYINANYGQANLGMVNTYTFTTAGSTATGKTDYTEDGRGSAAQIDGALGYETLLADSTTIGLEVGYRALNFKTITHNRDANTLAQGSVTKGTQILNADGSARNLNFGGMFAGIILRFWVY